MHECNAQTLILPPFGPKRWDVTITLNYFNTVIFFSKIVGIRTLRIAVSTHLK
jgi:hypothetical protein